MFDMWKKKQNYAVQRVQFSLRNIYEVSRAIRSTLQACTLLTYFCFSHSSSIQYIHIQSEKKNTKKKIIKDRTVEPYELVKHSKPTAFTAKISNALKAQFVKVLFNFFLPFLISLFFYNVTFQMQIGRFD